MIYLDNAATTPVTQRVLQAMTPYFTEGFGNPGSLHKMGTQAANAMQKARVQCAKPIHANPQNILFTSGGSEANTLAILGLAKYLRFAGKTHVITTKVEHPSVLQSVRQLQDKGFEVEYLPVQTNGDLSLQDLRNAIRPNTGLVSVMAVNNETGNAYDVRSVGKICREFNILFHTDFVQGYGAWEINVEEECIDFLSVSGHKFHAPKGVGFLYAGKKGLLSPIIFGGGQESGLRSGTENVPGIVGMGEAAEAASEILFSGCDVSEMRRLFYYVLQNHVDRFQVNGDPAYSSRILNLQFEGVDGETLLLLLAQQDVIVSAGSACAAHSAVPSHVLTAMGMTPEEARSSIRVSFSPGGITCEEVCLAATRVAKAVKFLRGE